MGLPGSGKTYLAQRLVPLLKANWLNNDKVREEADDWDFSLAGRERQASRMKNLAQEQLNKGSNVIADFVCPKPSNREEFDPDIIIWMDTIKSGRFEDTNQLFVPPKIFDFRVIKKQDKLAIIELAEKIKNHKKWK